MYYILMHRNYPGEKSFYANHFFSTARNTLILIRVCFGGLFEYELKNTCYKCWNFVNNPGSDLKIQYSCNYPQPTPTPHPQEVNSLISFYPLTVLWYFLHVGSFLNIKLGLKWSQYLFYNFIWRTDLASRCTPWWHWPIYVMLWNDVV